MRGKWCVGCCSYCIIIAGLWILAVCMTCYLPSLVKSLQVYIINSYLDKHISLQDKKSGFKSNQINTFWAREVNWRHCMCMLLAVIILNCILRIYAVAVHQLWWSSQIFWASLDNRKRMVGPIISLLVNITLIIMVRLELFSQKLEASGCPLPNTFGFIDGTHIEGRQYVSLCQRKAE